MKLDFKSLAFGYFLKNGNSTPAWETSLGQGKGYKLKEDNSINELVKGMIYKAVPSKSISFKKGKGGAFVSGEDDNSALVIAAVFDQVYINEHLIDGGKFILLISKDDSKSHSGRLKLKYGPDNKYMCNGTSIQNQMFLDLVKNQLGLSSNACWFVSDISVVDQDKLVLKTTIINPDGSEEYEDSKAHHEAWGVAESEDFVYPIDETRELEYRANKKVKYETGIIPEKKRNRILFGAPGTGKSFILNKERIDLLGDDSDDNYERVTFHPDYSYANFVGTYKPVMVSSTREIISEQEKRDILNVLKDTAKTAQEKYDLLYDKFKDEGLTRLPILLGLYTDESFKTRKQDGTDAVGDNSVERNHGKAIRPYVELLTDSSVSKEISYQYVPGPFMRTLVKALKNAMIDSTKPYLLLIEEINRANVAAVFGDVFQLLDRGANGVSEYEIATTNDMRTYLSEELGVDESAIETIKIPDNMFIWATMNSADQGVFPMDTAFKRRWDFSYLGIDDAVGEMSDTIKNKKYTLGTGANARLVNWNDLRSAINDVLSSESYNINEDKLLGPYFISKSILESEDEKEFIKVFKNKVLMYLFDDAAKQKRKTFFEKCKDEVKGVRYSDLCNQFDAKGVFIFPEEVSKRFIEKPTTEQVAEANEE